MLYEINLSKARKEGYAEGVEAGIAEGKAEGKAEGITESLKNLMEYMHITADEAMDIQKIPEEEREYYKSKLCSGFSDFEK